MKYALRPACLVLSHLRDGLAGFESLPLRKNAKKRLAWKSAGAWRLSLSEDVTRDSPTRRAASDWFAAGRIQGVGSTRR